jgi:glycosyltransferase involved in cell wall biosynthesis
VFSAAINSDAVIVPSLHAGNLFPDELKGKIRVRMEGFRLPLLHSDKKALRKKLGLPEQGLIVGIASRTLEAMRGFDVFLKVAKQLKQNRPDIHVLVIGSEQTIYGNELTYLGGKSFKQHVLDDLNITDDFLISRDYLEYDAFQDHLQAMDLIFFPLFEGAANWGLFEAMASGLPVIASNRCFIPEVISHGTNGFMVDPYDIEEMVSRSLNILDDPDASSFLGENARKKIKDHYSVEHSIAGYLAVINEVMGQNDNGMLVQPKHMIGA